jgi:hypothetical protein
MAATAADRTKCHRSPSGRENSPMNEVSTPLLEKLAAYGFAVAEAVYLAEDCSRCAGELQAALADCADERAALRRANGALYGARNLLTVFPQAVEIWRRPRLIALLTGVLGPEFGLVRGLYFDKPPENTWSLPWHQDLTIAVQDHSLPSERFKCRTVKAGVPHVEAPDEILQQMLTLRIHLDDVTDENGPLLVAPGTHRHRGAAATGQPVRILARAGDVLAIRPLLSHSSGASEPTTTRHRRVIHLEFAGCRELPDGYAWQQFVPV